MRYQLYLPALWNREKFSNEKMICSDPCSVQAGSGFVGRPVSSSAVTEKEIERDDFQSLANGRYHLRDVLPGEDDDQSDPVSPTDERLAQC